MFTGIITDIGEVVEIIEKPHERRFMIRTHYDTDTIDIGASIAHDGCCLTVTDIAGNTYGIDASPHTLKHTTLGRWKQGQLVNLERALKAGDELGGHLVSGHVDAVAIINDITSEGDSVHYTISCPEALKIYIAEKGSVTLNGTSLTVTWVKDAQFGLTLIPHTLQATNWGAASIGDELNIEIDMLARYMQRMLDIRHNDKN